MLPAAFTRAHNYNGRGDGENSSPIKKRRYMNKNKKDEKEGGKQNRPPNGAAVRTEPTMGKPTRGGPQVCLAIGYLAPTDKRVIKTPVETARRAVDPNKISPPIEVKPVKMKSLAILDEHRTHTYNFHCGHTTPTGKVLLDLLVFVIDEQQGKRGVPQVLRHAERSLEDR